MAPLSVAAVARQLTSQYNAALMLHERTRVVLAYLRAVHKGVVQLPSRSRAQLSCAARVSHAHGIVPSFQKGFPFSS
jgi:hypothetical protein